MNWRGASSGSTISPITGIAACCARAASGHETAAPPSSVMNSRRFTAPSLLCVRPKG